MAKTDPFRDLDPQALPYVEGLQRMSKRDLVRMARTQRELLKRMAMAGPNNRNELHAWIRAELGVDIPRVAVCDGHQSPFDFLADLYFHDITSAVAMANRGGSKTFLVAVLHYLNSRFRPGIESASVGAIEMQARRAYAHMQKLIERAGKDEIASTTMIDTRWKNGSRVEVLPGTISAVNGPHPCVVHVDEVELMDPEVYDESRNMSQGQVIDGRTYPAQDIITSTRKRGHGPMQKLIDEVKDAELAEVEPPYKLYTWCVFESAQAVPNCSAAGLGGNDPCPCKNVVKGKWANGKPRSLEDVCGGKFAKSAGFIPLDDIVNTFTKASKEIWEAQQECSRPSTEGMIVPQFERAEHAIRWWDPDPEIGPIYMAVDFGGTNPHAVNWYQLLRHDVDHFNRGNHHPIRIREGSIIAFDEIYIAEIGNKELADMIVARERSWRQKHPNFKTLARFGDPASKAARLDFAAHEPPLKTSWYVTREVEEHIKLVCEMAGDDRLYVDLERCPMWADEIEAWHRDKHGKPVDEFNHAMSNLRYAIANIRALDRKRNRMSAMSAPAIRKRTNPTPGPVIGGGLPRTEQWRKSLGSPISR